MRRVGMVVGVVEVCTVHERPCVVVPAFLKSLDRFLIREFIIMLSALISIFYLLIRYCSLELQKIIVWFSRENVRMHPVFKQFRSIVNSWIHNNAKRIFHTPHSAFSTEPYISAFECICCYYWKPVKHKTWCRQVLWLYSRYRGNMRKCFREKKKNQAR